MSDRPPPQGLWIFVLPLWLLLALFGVFGFLNLFGWIP